MSDNTFEPAAAEPADAGPVSRAQLRVPAGEGTGQRRAVLEAAIAMQEGRARARAYAANEELPDYLLPAYHARLVEIALRETTELRRMLGDPDAPGDELAVALEQAMVWAADTELSEIVDRYQREHGLLIDPHTATISLDPGFDAAHHDRQAITALTTRRTGAVERAAHTVLAIADLPEDARRRARAAVTRWSAAAEGGRGRGPAGVAWSAGPGGALDDGLAGLASDLAAAGVGASERAAIGFTAAYLTGDVTGIDLSATPLLLDPGDRSKDRSPGCSNNTATTPSCCGHDRTSRC